MAIHRSLDKIATPLSHLPTWFFIIGYPCFWMELYSHSAPDGVTSPWPWILFEGIALVCVGSAVMARDIGTKPFIPKMSIGPVGGMEFFFWPAAFFLALFIIGVILIAGLKPIHLMQEFDCLQYHYTLPRQHLILGSFVHIPWAADDLFLLPMDFALAPFWFATSLPNKIPQLIIFFGLMAVAMRLTSLLATERRPWAAPLVGLVILGTHGFGIQMGTGMLDLAITYLFLASLDSLCQGNWCLAAIEFTFFFWSKPLMPLEVTVILGIWFFIFTLARWFQWEILGTLILKHRLRAFGLFLILSVFVAGPFIGKSIYYAATPFFPLGPGMMGTVAVIKMHPQAWQSLEKASRLWMQGIKDDYGHGRSLLAFIKHWWLLALPEKGVNNAFDYPLGLTYLLMIGPFMYFLFRDLWQRKFHPLSVLVAVIWALWWFSAQQSRFLYLPLAIIFIVTIARFNKISKVLLLCLLVSLLLEALSVWNAHKTDLCRWGVNDLRVEDQQLVALNQSYLQNPSSNYVDWPSHDVAYAQFPVMVHKENLPHTIIF